MKGSKLCIVFFLFCCCGIQRKMGTYTLEISGLDLQVWGFSELKDASVQLLSCDSVEPGESMLIRIRLKANSIDEHGTKQSGWNDLNHYQGLANPIMDVRLLAKCKSGKMDTIIAQKWNTRRQLRLDSLDEEVSIGSLADTALTFCTFDEMKQSLNRWEEKSWNLSFLDGMLYYCKLPAESVYPARLNLIMKMENGQSWSCEWICK